MKKYIFHFTSFEYFEKKEDEPFFTMFSELCDVAIEDDVQSLIEVFEEFEEVYCFQLYGLYLLRYAILHSYIAKDKVEIRIYQNKEDYNILELSNNAKIIANESHYKQLSAWNNILMKFI